MKKILGLSLILALVLLVGCGIQNDTPEETINGAINAIKNSDTKQVSKYFKNNFSYNENKVPTKSSDLLVKDIEYKIISEDIENRKATVKVEITNLDVAYIMQEYEKNYDSSSNEGIRDKNVKEIFKDMDNKICELIKKYKDKKVTHTVDVKLTKGIGGWKIYMNIDLLNALFGTAMKSNY